MSLDYFNSLMRRSASMRSGMKDHKNEQDADCNEGTSAEGKAFKSGFLNNIKQRFQRRFTGVRSKYRSKARRSSSLSDHSDEPVPNNGFSECSIESQATDPDQGGGLNISEETNNIEGLRTQSLSGHLLQLSKYGWYWGPMTREEAEEKLANQPEGSFLVRDSSNDHFLLSVSFRTFGRTFHSRIYHSGGKFSFYSTPESPGFNSIPELVEHSINSSQSSVYCYSRPHSPGHPSYPVRLAKPVSRISTVRSLQYLCRFVIRQYIRVDQIKDLPLPARLCGYIEEGRF